MKNTLLRTNICVNYTLGSRINTCGSPRRAGTKVDWYKCNLKYSTLFRRIQFKILFKNQFDVSSAYTPTDGLAYLNSALQRCGRRRYPSYVFEKPLLVVQQSSCVFGRALLVVEYTSQEIRPSYDVLVRLSLNSKEWKLLEYKSFIFHFYPQLIFGTVLFPISHVPYNVKWSLTIAEFY